MKDTAQDVDTAFTAMFGALTAGDRLRMTCRMFDEAKALAVANIRASYPGISEAELRVKLFERLYLDDFTPEALARIVALMRQR